ncbi:uncharacterized protein isoform X1 [Danio rerio]|uniref:Uncharacterized protein LOC793726 n=1 Tax=Danio rerio TaxID=7955 RepID=B3DHT3_DANRE|nr:uncharacterized protein LOC793726 [Danio rerio]XP_005169673.1 uncharacterized protein LOC793726 isoform X1 [Danio rerio]AAI62879.1 Zgc:194297 [Danio rerio]AAI62891.1 Zgc:194297 [Danio rerio]|eukprot:NP_001129452.1 uncharacterized protein LOC793726 [Danio rerio]
MGQKGDLSDFQRGMIVGARQAGLSVSDTAELLGLSRTTVSRVYREWSLKDKTTTGRQECGRKSLVDDHGQKRMSRLIKADRKATVTELTARYNEETKRSISERTARRALKQMGYSKQKTTPESKAQLDDDLVDKEQKLEAPIPAEAPELNDTPSE